MSTSLSLLPVKGAWREILARVGAYLQEHHEPHPRQLDEGLLFVVDPRQAKTISALAFDLRRAPGAPPEGMEHWVGFTTELWFGDGHAATVVVAVHEAGPDRAHVELWFDDTVHRAVYAFDYSGRSIDHETKSDLVRLCIGVARAAGAAGFGYQLAREDSLFGPPSAEELRGYVEGPCRSHEGERPRRILAGLAVTEVDEDDFVYDVEDPPVHYRQDGFYLYDMLWPVDAFD